MLMPRAHQPARPDAVRSFPAIGAIRMIRIVIGRKIRPLSSASSRGRSAVERDEEEDAEHPERDEHRDDVRPANEPILKSSRSSIGSRWRSSSAMKTARRTAAPTKRPMISGDSPAVLVPLDERVASAEERRLPK